MAMARGANKEDMTSSRANRSTVAVGQVRRLSAQGSTATYGVVAARGERTLVQVVDAPGLHPGMRFLFQTDAVAEMEVVGAEETARIAPARRFSPLAA
jgi:transposase